VAVAFLAVLVLARRGVIVAMQEEVFGEITLRRTTAPGGERGPDERVSEAG
jgi:chromatin segregation and condensation protein Rec8/ScpA/Scc1 (kleisin family)